MTARELFELLNATGNADTPLMFDNGERFEYITELGITVYDDCVQID